MAYVCTYSTEMGNIKQIQGGSFLIQDHMGATEKTKSLPPFVFLPSLVFYAALPAHKQFKTESTLIINYDIKTNCAYNSIKTVS